MRIIDTQRAAAVSTVETFGYSLSISDGWAPAMRLAGIVVLLLAGWAFGFWTIYILVPDHGREAPIKGVAAVPVNLDLEFTARGARPEFFGTGWEKAEQWGVWSKNSEAVVFVTLPGSVQEDIALFIHGRARTTQQGAGARVTVSANGSILGIWRLSGEDQDQSSFIVSPEVANREVPLRITFQSETPALGLRNLRVRNVSSLTDFVGFVDDCGPTRISGWAKVGDLLSPINIRRAGRSVNPITIRNVHRSDLQANGLPASAGFEIDIPSSNDPASVTEVLFPNGKPLNSSPCRLP